MRHTAQDSQDKTVQDKTVQHSRRLATQDSHHSHTTLTADWAGVALLLQHKTHTSARLHESLFYMSLLA